MNNITHWPTEKLDMQLANSIIEKHLDINAGEPLGLVEIIVDENDNKVDVRPADWVLEIAERFCQKYGEQNGESITSMVLTRCLLKGETIH